MMAKKSTTPTPKPPIVMVQPRAAAPTRSAAVLPRVSSTTPKVVTPADRVKFDASAYRGAAGVAGVPALARPVPPNIYAQNAAQMKAAGARGLGQVQPFATARAQNEAMMRAAGVRGLGQVQPRRTVSTTPMPSPDTLERIAEQQVGAALGLPARTIDEVVNEARARSGIPPLGTPYTPSSGRGTSGMSGGGGSAGGGFGGGAAGGGGAGAGGVDFGGGMDMAGMLEQLRAGYGAQRSAIDAQIEAAIAAQAARRGSAEAAQRAAADQLTRILGELSAGATAAGQRVGEVYGGAGQRLGSLMQDYERMMAQRGEGAGRTLAAFGADASLAQPGGMSAADYLAAEQAALGRMGAAEQAYWAARPQAYQGLASDINTQRALQYEQLMNEIAQGEAAARAQGEADRARISTAEAQAILDAQMQAEQMRQQFALDQMRAGRSGGGGGGSGGGESYSFLPIPSVFGGM